MPEYTRFSGHPDVVSPCRSSHGFALHDRSGDTAVPASAIQSADHPHPRRYKTASCQANAWAQPHQDWNCSGRKAWRYARTARNRSAV